MAEPQQACRGHDDQFDDAVIQGKDGQAQHPSSPTEGGEHCCDRRGNGEDRRQHEQDDCVQREEKPPYGTGEHELHWFRSPLSGG